MAVLNFKGKTFVQNYHLSVPYHQLVPKKDKSLTDKVSLNDNLIVHGDNLKALKALLPNYAGKVKCIYIDPPYNTGNENWVYNDNVNSPMMQEWLGKVVDKEDLTRHDKWLCMMMPRMRLLRELLSDDGAIFISIDDNELHHLRMLMDEVFGLNNFVNTIAWQSRTSKQNDTDISNNHEYIVVYAKKRREQERRLKLSNQKQWDQIKEFAYYPLEVDESKFSNPDNDPRGKWKADPFDAPAIRTNLTYKIKNPKNGKTYLPPVGRHWRTEESEYNKLLKDKRIIFGRDGNSKPMLKVFYNEKEAFGEVDTTWWTGNERGTVTEATKQLEEIFGEKYIFDHPKPVRMIMALLAIATKKDDIVLDSFAGSGTTAHAVLAMNKSDSGNRKFIMIQCDEYNAKTQKIENICDSITAERVRRITKGIDGTQDETLKKGYGGEFSYFELGDAIEMESILEGKKLPSYIDLARYVFYTATGQEFDSKSVNEKKSFIGESKEYEVYLLYKPNLEYLKSTALTLDVAKKLGQYKKKRRIVFAPSKFLDTDYLLEYRIDYCQLPFEIYKLKE